MKILEEFWYGNIEPAEYDISPSKEYKELLCHRRVIIAPMAGKKLTHA